MALNVPRSRRSPDPDGAVLVAAAARLLPAGGVPMLARANLRNGVRRSAATAAR